MSRQHIIRQALKVGFQLEHFLTDLETHFNITPITANANDFFFVKFCVYAESEYGKPSLFVGADSESVK